MPLCYYVIWKSWGGSSRVSIRPMGENGCIHQFDHRYADVSSIWCPWCITVSELARVEKCSVPLRLENSEYWKIKVLIVLRFMVHTRIWGDRVVGGLSDSFPYGQCKSYLPGNPVSHVTLWTNPSYKGSIWANKTASQKDIWCHPLILWTDGAYKSVFQLWIDHRDNVERAVELSSW
jgi:hypothetical protein